MAAATADDRAGLRSRVRAAQPAANRARRGHNGRRGPAGERGSRALNYWLLKSEPGTYGIDDLAAAPGRSTCWEGIRNYQVRNIMRDQMRRNDRAFFYHSSCAAPGIAGTVRVVRSAYPDQSAFDRRSRYFDATSDPDDPHWLTIDVSLLRKFERPISLAALRQHSGGALRDMWVLRRGNRLSITPVTAAEWKFIHGMLDE